MKICLCLDFKCRTKVKSETGHPSWVAFCKIYLFSRYTEKLLVVVFQFTYFDFAGKRWSYFFTPTRPRPVDERQLVIFYTSSEWFGGKSQSHIRGVLLKYFNIVGSPPVTCSELITLPERLNYWENAIN